MNFSLPISLDHIHFPRTFFISHNNLFKASNLQYWRFDTLTIDTGFKSYHMTITNILDFLERSKILETHKNKPNKPQNKTKEIQTKNMVKLLSCE